MQTTWNILLFRPRSERAMFVWPTACRRMFSVGSFVRVCSLACPGHPSLRCSRFPVGKADIPVLVNQAAPHPLRLQFRKAGFQEAKQKSDMLRGSRCWRRGGQQGNRHVFVVLNGRTNHRLPLKLRPPCRQLVTERLSPHPPLAVSLSKHRCSRCQWLVTMAKLNNGRFVNTTICVGSRPTTAFLPPLSPFPVLTTPRTGKLLVIGCGWIVGGRGPCCVSAVMISEGVQPAGHHLRRLLGVSSGRLTDRS